MVLSNNLISSTLPSELGFIQYLDHLYDEDRLREKVEYPDYPDRWEPKGMPYVDLARNQLTGTLPAALLLGDQIYLQQNLFSAVSTEIGVFPSPSRMILDLSHNFVSSVPTELFLLTTLQRLSLEGNQLAQLPSEIGQIAAHVPLDDIASRSYCPLDLTLSSNKLETIPLEISHMLSLETWALQNNSISELPRFDWGSMDQVRTINLSHNIFQTMPMELFRLPSLVKLDLSSNRIADSLSPDIAFNVEEFIFSKFSHLNLSNNSLSGTIPFEIGMVDNLSELDLSLNLLNGTIPLLLAATVTLETLILFSNSLTGTIPTFFENITELKTLDLRNNQLTGSIPSEIGLNFGPWGLNHSSYPSPPTPMDTTTIFHLLLANNSLSASLPSEIGLLTNLEVVDVSYNTLSGTIPTQLGKIHGFQESLWYDWIKAYSVSADWSFLHALNMSHNNLMGTVPTELGVLTNLHRLDLSFNSLTGSIPSEIALINATALSGWTGRYGPPEPKRTNVVFIGNDFSGSLPQELCEWYCNGKACSSGMASSCDESWFMVDCLPGSHLDCSACTC